MRLSKESKTVLLGNIEVLKFCRDNKIDISRLKECSIEVMGRVLYIFTLPKDNMPVSNQLIPLDYDIGTQPDAVLIMEIKNDKIVIKTTENTRRLLNIN